MRIYKNTTNEYYFITWKDKKPVNLFSALPNDKSLIRRRDENGNNNEFMCPTNVIIYNKTMGGTDVFDQKMQYYFPYIRTLKWTCRVIIHFFYVTVINLQILYRLYHNLNRMIRGLSLYHLSKCILGS